MNQHQLTMTRGDSQTFTVTMTDSAGDPYDLTDATVSFSVGDLFTKTLDDGITVQDPETGVATITVSPDDTEGVRCRRTSYRYDVEVTLGDGTVKTPIRGLFVIVPDVTTD